MLNRTRLTDAGLVFLVWLVGAGVFFREQWRSGFKTLMGNDGDTRLAAYLCEHWFRVWHGQDSWLNPGFFYPIKGMLGWSDTFLLYEVFYAPLRLLGCDPFLALQLTVVLLSLVGLASMVALVRVAFGAPRGIALAAGTMFAFSNALWLHVSSAQESGVYLVPLVLLLGVLAWRRAAGGWRTPALALGAAGGVLAALLIYSTYYTSYFSILSGGVLILILILTSPRHAWVWAREALVRQWRLGAVVAGSFVIGLIPFVLTYLTARPEDPGSNYADAMAYAAHPKDLVNVGGGNLLWNSVIHSTAYELTYAVTPLLMLAALVGGALCAWWLWSGTATRPAVARAAVALAATALIAELLPMRTRYGTPWAVIYHLPGAGAMRAIDRIALVAGLAAVLALTAAASEIWAHRVGLHSLTRAAVVVGLTLAVLEQVNTTPNSVISRRVQTRLLSSAAQAPRRCRAFYVIDSKNATLPDYESQIDAMLISQNLGLPTVNGYTAYKPVGWDLSVVGSPDYAFTLRDWLQRESVRVPMCQLDLATMRWQGP